MAHALERGARKSAEFLLNHGRLLLLRKKKQNFKNLFVIFEYGMERRVFCFIAAQGQGTVEDFLYDVDVDGNSLLHLAVNSGVLAVSMRIVVS